MVVYKYVLDKFVCSRQELRVPKKFEVLSIHMQNDMPVLWILVDEKIKETCSVTVMRMMTGEIIEKNVLDEFFYVGTYQHGWRVEHLFLKEN